MPLTPQISDPAPQTAAQQLGFTTYTPDQLTNLLDQYNANGGAGSMGNLGAQLVPVYDTSTNPEVMFGNAKPSIIGYQTPGQDVQYDVNGNVTSGNIGGYEYTFDNSGNVTSKTKVSSSPLAALTPILGIAASAILAPELLPEVTGIGGDATAAALATTGGEVTPAMATTLAADSTSAGLLSAGDSEAANAVTQQALADAGFNTAASQAAPDVEQAIAQATPVADQSVIQSANLGDLPAPATTPAAPATTPVAAPAQTTLADVANIAPVQPAASNTSLYDLANTQAATPVTAPVADTSTALTTPTSGPSLTDMGGAQGVQAPANFGTAAYADQLPTGLTDMGGAQGITTGSTAGLASMGGAQGIVAPTSSILGDTSSFINDPTITGVGSTIPTANVSGAGITPTGSNVLGNPNSLVNAGTAGTVGASTAPVTSAISPAVTDAATNSGGLLSNLSPLQMASLGSALAGGVGGLINNQAISSAQAQQQAAAAQAQNTLSGIYSGLNQQIAPYQQAGQSGLTGLQNNLGYFQNQFNNQDLNSQLAPNYQFMLGQGQMANQRAANVGGGALSGNTLQGLNTYTQDYAQNAYQNAFNNYQTQRTGIYNTLAGIAGLGTSANQQAVTAGSQYGNQATNLATGIAAANAGATVGQAQNTSNTLSNLTNNLTLASLLGQKAG